MGLTVCAIVGPMLPRWLLGPVLPAARVELRPLVQTVAATGRVRPPARLEISVTRIGKVSELHCAEGQHVEAGALLFRLSDEQERAAVALAEAEVAKTEARLDELARTSRKTDFEDLRRAEIAFEDAAEHAGRLERLAASGAINQRQLEEAQKERELSQSRLATAQLLVTASGRAGTRSRLVMADVTQARANLAVARARLEDSTVLAPAAGILASCDVYAGMVLTPGRLAMVLVRDGPLEIVIEPDEKNLALLRVGQPARVAADAFPDRPFSAQVTTIVPAVNPLRGTVEVRLTANEHPAFIIPDLSVSVEIEANRRERTLVVQTDALRGLDTGRPWLFRVMDGRVRRVDVELGLKGDGVSEILSGASAGDVVLLLGLRAVEAGSRARPRLPES